MTATVHVPSQERLKIFVASPGDVGEERDIVLELLDTFKLVEDFFDVYCWEETLPGFGSPAQQQIDDQVPADQCHIVLVIFWHRFGTPPGIDRPDGRPYNSGTESELDRAIQAYDRNQNGLPRIMVYRKTDDPCDRIKDDPDEIIQYGRLLEFFKNFEPRRSWVYPFKGEKFEEIIKRHLAKVIREVRDSRNAVTLVADPPTPLPVNPVNAVAAQPAGQGPEPTTYPKPAAAGAPAGAENGPSHNSAGAVVQWTQQVGLTGVLIDAGSVEDGSVSNKELRDLIRFWLTSLSSNKLAPFRSIGQLCASRDNLDNRIDQEIVALAQGSPRNAQWLIEHLLQFHCAEPNPPQRIQPESWLRVRYEWEYLKRPWSPTSGPADFRLQGGMVYFGERQLVLAVREQNLLRVLVEGRGETCTIEELTTAGWPGENASGVQRKTVQEAIHRLRKKLADKYGIDFDLWLETHREQGYRLRLPDEVRNPDPAQQKGGAHVH